MPKFLLKFQAAVIKEIPIEKTPLTIGRKPDNDIVIDNMAVSGHHAQILLQGKNYVIEDLKSTNGTFVNEKKIVSSAVKNNDQIQIGQHILEFINPEAAQESAIDSDATILLTPQKQAQIFDQVKNQPSNVPQEKPVSSVNIPAAAPIDSQAAAKTGAKNEVIGLLRVIEGKADTQEYTLSNHLTYIGKAESAAIKIKGLFAPDIAALISKKNNVFILSAVKEGYPKLNNTHISGQIELKDNDILEVGGIKFLFQIKENKSEEYKE